uniref:PWI domain-containing protein n=1 Tax=Heligmosomoides polygyrus TaxID=6339 RepID=A0A183G1M0_HELPZ
LKKQIKEKEQAYVSRLTKWEARERQKAKQYEREERREKDRRRDILKEAKKLKHFLEDYDDEKDDPKYYKSSSLFQRKRDFEREREADSKDRLREQQEIDELRKQILAENKDVQDEEAAMRRLREDSGSPNPHQPLGQRDGDGDSSSSSADSDDDDDVKSIDGKSIGDDDEDSKTQKSDAAPSTAAAEDRWKSVEVASQPSPLSVSSPVTLRGASSTASVPAIQRPELNARLNGVFGVEDEDEEGSRKQLRPFEITQEERMETLTTDEKKRMVKDLINNIPTTKEELFAHKIDWRFVDRSLIEQRVRPWVAKKIMEFLGEEEAALVSFVCEKVAAKTSPDRILSDIAMVSDLGWPMRRSGSAVVAKDIGSSGTSQILDEDAEVFVVKMWRLLIYESEAKKLGLVVPRSSQ